MRSYEPYLSSFFHQIRSKGSSTISFLLIRERELIYFWRTCWLNLKTDLFVCTGRSLGSGTFGKVRIGTHTITGEKVAIKILEKDRIKDKGDVERVTREINILKKVRHPNVIQLYEVSLSQILYNCLAFCLSTNQLIHSHGAIMSFRLSKLQGNFSW